MTFDPFPLFEEEQGPWERTGMMVAEGDDHGTFAFAILPGAIYNEIRSRALSGGESFEAVLLREAPAGLRHPSGALRYDELARRGFTGAPPWAEELYGESFELGSSDDPIVAGGEKLRWLRKLARGFRKIGDLIRRGIAAVRVALGDTEKIRLRIRIVEHDEAFLGHSADEANDADLLTQAWQGSGRGQPVTVRGARVTFSSNMWMVQRFVDDNGFVTATVPDTRRKRIQLWLQSDAGQIVTAGGIFDQRLNITDDVVSEDAFGRLNVSIESQAAYVLGQVTDSWSYAREVLGITPRSAIVALLPAERASFAPCLSYVRFELLLAALAAGAHTSAIAGAVPALPAGIGAVNPFAVPDWDVMIQGSDAQSRLVPTHPKTWYDGLFDTGRRDSWFARMDDPAEIREGLANLALPKGDGSSNAIVVHSGYGDGYYPLIATFDAKGELVAVHIDFLVVTEAGDEDGEDED